MKASNNNKENAMVSVFKELDKQRKEYKEIFYNACDELAKQMNEDKGKKKDTSFLKELKGFSV